MGEDASADRSAVPAGPGATVSARGAALAIALVMATVCVSQAFGRTTWSVVLPDARDDILHGSNTLAGLFGTLNLAAYLIGALLVAYASARLPLVRVVRSGLAVATAGFALAAFAPAAWAVALGLVLTGLGGAAVWIPAPRLVTGWLPSHRHGMGVGLLFVGSGIGVVFASQLASFLDRASDSPHTWQMVYRIEFGIAVLVLIAAAVFLHSEGDRPATIRGFGGFDALRFVPGWVPLTLVYTAFGFSYSLVYAFFVARLKDDAGFSAAGAQAMFTIVGAAGPIGGLAAGAISDRIGSRTAMTWTSSLAGAATLLALSNSVALVVVAAVGIGFTMSGTPAMIGAYMTARSNPDTYGPAYSAITLAFGVGLMIAPQIGGAMGDALGSFAWVFVAAAAASGLGAVAATRLPDGGGKRSLTPRLRSR